MRGKRWTADDISLLGSASDRRIAKQLGRTVNAVCLKRRKLRIPAAENDCAPGEITTNEAATLLQVSTSAIGYYVQCGHLVPVSAESPWRFLISDVENVPNLIALARSVGARRGADTRKRQQPQLGSGEMSVEMAADHAQVTDTTIRNWHANGILKSLSEEPLRFLQSAVETAKKEAARRRIVAAKTASCKSAAKRHVALPPGIFNASTGATHAGVSTSTVHNWVSWGWLNVVSESPLTFTRDAIDAAKDHAIGMRQASIRKAHEAKYPVPKPGTGSASDAAAHANISEFAIREWYKKGLLRAVCKRPLRFAFKAVDEAVSRLLPVGNGDVPIYEIPSRITGSCERDEVIQRVRSVVRRADIPSYWRRGPVPQRRGTAIRHITVPVKCVREEQLPRILQHIQDDSKQPANDLSVNQASKEFKRSGGFIKERLTKYAPDAGRDIKHRGKNGLRDKTVYPREAIAAALRGKRWTPPEFDEQTGTEMTVDSTRAGDSPPKRKRKRKGGAPSKWDHVVDEYKRQKRGNPKLKQPAFLQWYAGQFPGRPCPTYDQFKVAKSYRSKQ